MDALVRAVPTSDVTQIAAYALVAIDPRHDLVIQIEVLPFRYLRQGATTKIFNRRKALLEHPVRKTIDQVLYDSISVMHRRRADLDSAAPQQHELGCLTPAGYATDPGDRQRDLRVRRDLLHKVQRYRFH